MKNMYSIWISYAKIYLVMYFHIYCFMATQTDQSTPAPDFILSSDWLSASSVPPTNVAKSRIVLHFFLVFN